MKKINFLLALLISFSSLFSQQIQKTGTTAAQILKINAGPKAIGMGGAFCATANDAYSFYWNPAGISNIQTAEAAFSHMDLYSSMLYYNYASGAFYIDGIGSVGLFVNYLSTDEMPVRTLENPEGTGEMFGYSSLVLGLGFARNLTELFSIGFNLKYINENLYHMSAQTFAFDIGVLYKIDVLNQLRIAGVISNFGPKMKLDGRDIIEFKKVGNNFVNTKLEVEEYDLPMLFRIGLAADFLKTENLRMTAEVNAIHPNDHSEHINLGLEFSWSEVFFIRSGYNALFEYQSEKGLTFGVGFNLKLADYATAKFDYAYQDFGRLSQAHYFGFGIKL